MNQKVKEVVIYERNLRKINQMDNPISLRNYQKYEKIFIKKDVKDYNKKKTINQMIIVISIILICILISLIIIYISKRLDQRPNTDSQQSTIISPNSFDSIEIEFTIKTQVNDLKRIYVFQKYYEIILSNGQLIRKELYRKTYYDIYIISEKESDEKNKKFYNKTYLASISIVKECISREDENCEPKQMVDLTGNNILNIRNFEEIDELKDLPISLCLFNLTDNDVITSMICPESLPESKRQNMILDLYFFRPPSIKRLDKEVQLQIIEKKILIENIL